jgi:hypothetical protein
MVVGRKTVIGMVACTLLACNGVANAQSGSSIRAWVEETEVEVDQAFWLFVELKGSRVSDPIMPKVENVIINTDQPQYAKSFKMANSVTQEKRSFAFPTRIIKEGTIRIPPIQATIDGKVLKSEAVVLNVISNAPPGQPSQVKLPQVRLYVDNPKVVKDKPFWLNLEASGSDIRMPRSLDIDGLLIDPRKVKRSSAYSFQNGITIETFKLQYYAVPQRVGSLTIPPVESSVNGLIVKSNELTLDVVDGPASVGNPGTSQPAPAVKPAGNPTPKDYVFIDMVADKQEVYQGEAIMLRMQLWRVQARNNSINSGPSSGDTIIDPTTQGFYVEELDPRMYKETRNNWPYTVNERRQLLYPLKTGDLQVGAWHWEGIALVDTFRLRSRRRFEYTFDAPALNIKVKPLPPGPEAFSGAVGEFLVQANLSENVLNLGVPVEYTVIVRGTGNPDAIGAPVFPKLDWAQVGEPTSNLLTQTLPGEEIPSITKVFTIPIIPNKSGRFSIPEFSYVFFNPRKEVYETIPFEDVFVNVGEANESQSHIVVPESVQLLHRKVEVLEEDIHPALKLDKEIKPAQDHSLGVLGQVLVIAPVVLFGFVFISRRRKLNIEHNRHHIRARKAKVKGLKRLQTLYEQEHPEEELYQLLMEFIAEKLHLESNALTSSDVGRHLSERKIDTQLCDTVTSILKSCERHRYASEKISETDLQALMYGVEAAMHDLDVEFRKGRRK